MSYSMESWMRRELMPFILVKRNKKLTLAKNIYWTFQLLLLPSSAKTKMQMPNSVLFGMYTMCDKS